MLSNTNSNGSFVNKREACKGQEDPIEFKEFSSYTDEEERFIVRVQVDNFVHCYDIRSIIEWVKRKKMSGQEITCPVTRQSLSCIADELLEKAESVIPNFDNPFRRNVVEYDGTNIDAFSKNVLERIESANLCEELKKVEDDVMEVVHIWRKNAKKSDYNMTAYNNLRKALYADNGNTSKCLMDVIKDKKKDRHCETFMSSISGGRNKKTSKAKQPSKTKTQRRR